MEVEEGGRGLAVHKVMAGGGYCSGCQCLGIMSNEQCHWPRHIRCAICLGRAAQIMCDALAAVCCAPRGIGQGPLTCMYSEKQQRPVKLHSSEEKIPPLPPC